MCVNAVRTAADLLAAIEPTFVNLLSATGLASAPNGEAAITAFAAMVKAVAAWTSGTTAQDVIEIINDFTTIFSGLPIPADAKTLEQIISAGIVTVIAVLTANSPAPSAPTTATAPAAAPEETQAMHVAHTVAAATAQVNALVPEFKRSIWHSPAHQYTSAWNARVKAADAKYALLVIA